MSHCVTGSTKDAAKLVAHTVDNSRVHRSSHAKETHLSMRAGTCLTLAKESCRKNTPSFTQQNNKFAASCCQLVSRRPCSQADTVSRKAVVLPSTRSQNGLHRVLLPMRKLPQTCCGQLCNVMNRSCRTRRSTSSSTDRQHCTWECNLVWWALSEDPGRLEIAIVHLSRVTFRQS